MVPISRRKTCANLARRQFRSEKHVRIWHGGNFEVENVCEIGTAAISRRKILANLAQRQFQNKRNPPQLVMGFSYFNTAIHFL